MKRQTYSSAFLHISLLVLLMGALLVGLIALILTLFR